MNIDAKFLNKIPANIMQKYTINKMKNKNHDYLNRWQRNILDKTSIHDNNQKKKRYRRHNILKVIYDKLITNIMLNGKVRTFFTKI